MKERKKREKEPIREEVKKEKPKVDLECGPSQLSLFVIIVVVVLVVSFIVVLVGCCGFICFKIIILSFNGI